MGRTVKWLAVKTLPVCSEKNLQVPALLWIWPRAIDPSALASMTLDIFVSLTWQYDPNSRWPSTFVLKGRPYRIWKAVISVGLVELLKIDILEAT